MKVDKRIPLVHIERLQRPAQESGCEGLLAYMAEMRKMFRERKRRRISEPTRPTSSETSITPLLEAAWTEMCDAMEAKYKEREEEFDAEYNTVIHGDDCTGIYRFYVYMLEIVPTL